MDAINNLKGVSLLSAPASRRRTASRPTSDIVREFPYPTSFEKPKLSSSSNLAYSGGPDGQPAAGARHPAPRRASSSPRDVGVSLEVKPTTYPDPAHRLSTSQGAGARLRRLYRLRRAHPHPTQPDRAAAHSGRPDHHPGHDQPAGLRPALRPSPTCRSSTARPPSSAAWCAKTRRKSNDKIPLLGDLPLIGRAFQSKVNERTKKSLMIFITARLIRSNGQAAVRQDPRGRARRGNAARAEPINLPGGNLPPARAEGHERPRRLAQLLSNRPTRAPLFDHETVPHLPRAAPRRRSPRRPRQDVPDPGSLAQNTPPPPSLTPDQSAQRHADPAAGQFAPGRCHRPCLAARRRMPPRPPAPRPRRRPPRPPSRSPHYSIGQLRRQEIVRRQELIYRAGESLKGRAQRRGRLQLPRGAQGTISSAPRPTAPSRAPPIPTPPRPKVSPASTSSSTTPRSRPATPPARGCSSRK